MAKDLILIAAVAGNGVIGKDNKIPWRIKQDMQRFKELTLGHPVVRGRKTWESIPKKFRPLPERENIIVTSNMNYEVEGDNVFLSNSLDDAIYIGSKFSDKLFLIGGERIYREGIELANKMELTEIGADFDGDTFFPEFSSEDWRESNREYHKGSPDYSFVTYERV